MKETHMELSNTTKVHIADALTVPHLPEAYPAMKEMPTVFATAYMVAFIEASCIEALAPWLEEGEGTVGTYVGVSHIAATPVGLDVTAAVRLISREGRKLRFQVACHDGVDLICEGFHERFLIDRARFDAGLTQKLEKARLSAKGRR